MQEFGSLQNVIYSSQTHTIPEVDMGATLIMWTDRRPYTIIEVSKSGKKMKIQSDDWERLDNNGISESQEYEFTRDPNGIIQEATLRKDGTWRVKGSSQTVFVGKRMKYEDPTF